MIELTTNPIDAQAVLAHVASPRAGAVVLFLGTVRELTGDVRTLALDYESYPEMARGELAKLEATARERWPLVGCALVHRLGHLLPGETSVAVAVSTPHRADAFEAGQWLIDELKGTVPIWKRDHTADGLTAWVHPGTGCCGAGRQPSEPRPTVAPGA